MNFEESSLALSLHQLIGDEWAFGASYRISEATLKDNYVDVSDQVATDSLFPARTKARGTLQMLNAHAIWQEARGLFARLDATWMHQRNIGYQPTRSNEDFWHLDAMAGYRFPRRRIEFAAGVMNLTGQNYQLSPLNLHAELFHGRTFVAQLRFQF